MTVRPSSRVASVDVLRSLAIALALFQHSLSTFAVWPSFNRLVWVLVRVLADVATPAFVLVFGIMLELIYVPRLARVGSSSVTRSLLRRASDCYLTYVATIAAAILGGRRSFGEGMAATVLLGNTRYGNILKFYALALPLSVVLLRVRCRLGLRVLVGLAIGTWLVVPGLAGFDWPPPTTRLSYLTATLAGHPAGRAWLSLLHSVPLIVAGMLLGNGLARTRDGDGRRPYHRALLGVLAPCAVFVLEMVRRMGWRQFARGSLFLTFRSTHHLAYYVLGLGEATGCLLVMTWMWPPGATIAPRLRPLLALGQRSLLTFTVGSCVLNAWPARVGVSPATGLALSLTLPVAMAVLAIWRGARTRIV